MYPFWDWNRQEHLLHKQWTPRLMHLLLFGTRRRTHCLADQLWRTRLKMELDQAEERGGPWYCHEKGPLHTLCTNNWSTFRHGGCMSQTPTSSRKQCAASVKMCFSFTETLRCPRLQQLFISVSSHRKREIHDHDGVGLRVLHIGGSESGRQQHKLSVDTMIQFTIQHAETLETFETTYQEGPFTIVPWYNADGRGSCDICIVPTTCMEVSMPLWVDILQQKWSQSMAIRSRRTGVYLHSRYWP